MKADPHASATRCAPSHGYKWPKPVDPAGMAKHYFGPRLAALGLSRVRWRIRATQCRDELERWGARYLAVSKMLGHASFVTTLTVYGDYIMEGDMRTTLMARQASSTDRQSPSGAPFAVAGSVLGAWRRCGDLWSHLSQPANTKRQAKRLP